MSLRWISLDELANVVGQREAVDLCGTYGGRNPYLPSRPRPTHAFVRIIGWEKFALLCAYAGGYHLDLPNLRRPAPAKEAIWDALDSGQTHDSIADKYDVTVRYVRELQRQRRWVQRQGRLPI